MNDIEVQLRNLEEQLLQSAVRRDPEAVSALLTDDFREFGSSGRIFNKQQIFLALQEESPSQLSLTDFQAAVLAPDAVLVTYRAMRSHDLQKNVSQSLHSSIWVFRNAGWRMLFHQGTRSPGDS